MLLKLRFSMTKKYLVSPVMEAARLSGGGHVMAAWEATMSTYPTSPFGRWRRSRAFSSTPEKPPHGVGVWARGPWARSIIDFVCCVFGETKTRLCFPQRWPKPTSHRPNVATLGNTQGQACALCWRKTLCAGGTLECIGLPPSHLNMLSLTMSRTSPSRGRPIYPAVETHPQPLSSTSTTLLSSISGQQQPLQRVPSPVTAHSAEHPALH